MKAVQITFDEELLAALDEDRRVQAEGRSAVLRALASEYLARRRREEIAEQYRAAYADGDGLGEELAGWEEQGEWPSL